MNTKETIIVGLSGGVDSAVAAMLLLQQGYDVQPVFMKNWDEDDSPEHCPAEQDLADAREVCARLGLELRSVSFSAEYWDRVFAYFLDEYRAGRTPNPDILCNREIKFRAFLDYARSLGATRIATGHYARTQATNTQVQLLKGIDSNKDQSYFLFRLDQEQLAASLFPLGELPKDEVRALARNAGLANHAKKDSTGICFIGERKFNAFLKQYLPARPGPVCTPDGEEIGTHQGLMFHTIGQRQGLGIGGLRGAGNQPWYVAAKDLDNNRLIVVQGAQHPLLFQPALFATQVHWIRGEAPPMPLTCMAKIRYRQPDQACRVEIAGEDRVLVRFAEAQRAVTPGQSVVFYRDSECLGGATITAGVDIISKTPSGAQETSA